MPWPELETDLCDACVGQGTSCTPPLSPPSQPPLAPVVLPPPPSSVPPPTSPAPPDTEYRPQLLVSLITAGDVQSFDQKGFKARLALIAGVMPADITLKLTSASVLVRAVIRPPDAATTQTALDALDALALQSYADISAQLGVSVEFISQPEYQLELVPTSPRSGLRKTNIAIIIIVICLMVPVALFLLSDQRRRSARANGRQLQEITLVGALEEKKELEMGNMRRPMIGEVDSAISVDEPREGRAQGGGTQGGGITGGKQVAGSYKSLDESKHAITVMDGERSLVEAI